MDVGAEIIGMVKTNIKGLCKETIDNMAKDWPGGSYLALNRKCMVPRDRLIMTIGYNYNTYKFLYFVST